ncbi:DEP1B protein, partial [Atractosteus spatula]|nr:DEP1B protein [Atractosteus spatula]
MPLRRHRMHFRSYDSCFTASEAADWLHELLRSNNNFGPEVTRTQTIQLLKKFLKNHVIQDIKGRWGTEHFEDNGHLYRFPPSSPLKPLPKRPQNPESTSIPRFPNWDDYEQRDMQENVPVKPIIVVQVHECKLIRRREITPRHVEQIWKSMTLAHLQRVLGLKSLDGVLDAKHLNPKYIIHNVYNINKQGVVVLEDKSQELPHWVLSAMKCLASWPNGSELKQPMYPGFERDVFRTVADYFQKLKEPLLTFQLYEMFVNILGENLLIIMLTFNEYTVVSKFGNAIQGGFGKQKHNSSLFTSLNSLCKVLQTLYSQTYHLVAFFFTLIPGLLHTLQQLTGSCLKCSTGIDEEIGLLLHFKLILIRSEQNCSEKLSHVGNQNARMPELSCSLLQILFSPSLINFIIPVVTKINTVKGVLQKQQVATEALQVCCLLLPPENRRKLQLLMRLMARILQNTKIPPLNNAIGTRTLVVQTFSRCILCSADEVDLDELLATKLVTFMMDHYEDILKVPSRLQKSVEEHLSQLQRVQIKYAGADADASFVSHSYCKQISKEEFEEQRANSTRAPMAELLEGIIKDTELSVKDKKKKLKQFQKSYPDIYKMRFPTVESEAALFPEKPKLKPQLMFFTLKKPFQPFQRTRSFRA